MSTLPAMRGKFGSTEYFIITMKAKELTEKLTVASDYDNWKDLSIEEKYQREINYNRVKKDIAPYLINEEDRFFGAFIVYVINGEDIEFESITKNVGVLPNAYKPAMQCLGTITLKGDEIFVPIDGQHRVKALDFAINGKDNKGIELPDFRPNPDIARDVCTIILINPLGSVRERTLKVRKIFNKVNRYAKKTSKAENLITADDDIFAVICRSVIAGEVIDSDVINHKSNTLNKSSPYFTTLSTIYEATRLIIEGIHDKRISTTELPAPKEYSLYKKTAKDFWIYFLKIRLFADAINGDIQQRIEIRETYTLGKPIVQWALVEACIELMQPDRNSGDILDWHTLRQRIDSVNWKVDNEIWQQILMIGNKVITGTERRKFAARFLSYYLGKKISEDNLNKIKEDYENYGGKEFPNPIA